MQDHSSFNSRHNIGSNSENRFCRLPVYCEGGPDSENRLDEFFKIELYKMFPMIDLLCLNGF